MSVRAKERTGNKNSFYGKTHSQETKEIIGLKNKDHAKKRFESMTEDERKKLYGSSGANNPIFGKKRSEETKQKISETRKRKLLAGEIVVKHQPVSEETKQKISISLSGENHPMFGKKQSEETKRKREETRLRNLLAKHASIIEDNINDQSPAS